MDELQEDGQLIAGIGAHGKPESIDTDVKVLWSTGDSHLSQFEVIQDEAGVATVSVKSPSPGSDPSLTGGEDMGHPGVQIFKTEMDIATDTELTHQQGSVSEESHILTSDDITEGQMLHVPETEDGAMLSGDPTVPSSIQVATSLASELAANADQDVIQLLLPPDDMCKMTEPGDGQTTSLHTMNISLGSSVITSSPIVAPPTLSAQAITLSDGSTAFIQHPTGKFMEGQTITLEDGTTAVVQGISNKLNLVTSLPNATGLVKTELGGGDSQNTGGVATTQQPVQLEDGATTFLNQAVKDGLQAIILEDGTTAYLATQQSPGFLESPSQLEATATLTLDQLTTSQQVAGVTGGGAVGVAGGVAVSGVSGVQHLLTNGLVNVDVKTLALHGQTVVTNGLDPSQMTAGVKTAIVTTNPSVSDKTASPFVEKAYRCSYDGCGRYYTTLHHLRVHERSHTGDRPFRCEFNGCGKAFATGYGLKSHTRVHTGEKPYKCPDESCDKAFKTSGDLQKHVRTHTGERPFKCPFEGCTRWFTTSNIRKMHKLHYFQGSRERPFKCPFEGCTRSFTTSNIRKVHIRTHTGERPYTCPEEGCGRAFASATNYKNHIRIHTGEKPYVCTVQGCGKRFTEYSSLYKHHVVHTHAKPYTCNRCGKTYRQTSTLAMHKRTAHGEDVTAESEAVLFQEQAAMDTFETVDKRNRFNFSINHDDMQDDGEGTLVINTSDPGQQLTLVGTDSLTAVSADALQAPTLAGQTALLQQAGVATFTLGDQGQQVYVITDPAQLEALQQIAQHQFDTEQLDNSLITSLTAVAGGADTTVLEPGDVTTVTEITSPPNDITDAAVVSINGAGVAELQAFQTDT